MYFQHLPEDFSVELILFIFNLPPKNKPHTLVNRYLLPISLILFIVLPFNSGQNLTRKVRHFLKLFPPRH